MTFKDYLMEGNDNLPKEIESAIKSKPFNVSKLSTWLKDHLNMFNNVKYEGKALLLDFKGGVKYMSEKDFVRLVKDIAIYKGSGKAVVMFNMRDDSKWILK